MIKLSVEDYCNNCPDFDAYVNTSTYKDGFGEEMVNHVIVCRDSEKCNTLMNYLVDNKNINKKKR